MDFLKRRIKINRKILLIIAIIFSIGICAYISVNMHFLLCRDFQSMLNLTLKEIVKILFADKRILMIFIILETIVITLLLLCTNKTKNIYHSKTIKLTDKISVPIPAGDGQYGTAWWLKKKDYDKIFSYNIIDRTKEYKESCFKSGGIITNLSETEIQKKYIILEIIYTQY